MKNIKTSLMVGALIMASQACAHAANPLVGIWTSVCEGNDCTKREMSMKEDRIVHRVGPLKTAQEQYKITALSATEVSLEVTSEAGESKQQIFEFKGDLLCIKGTNKCFKKQAYKMMNKPGLGFKKAF